jgi:hypothetical protein
LIRRGALPAIGFNPTSAQSAAFLARATNITSTTDKTNYDTMITGLVNDGVWALLDVLYIFSTVDRTTALLNLIQNNFNAVEHGTINFTAYQGYTGDGSTFYLDTQFGPSTAAGNFSQNSSSAAVYVLTNSTTDDGVGIGQGAVNNDVRIAILVPSGMFYAITGANNFSITNTNRMGFYTASRTNSSSTAIYKNGSSVFSNPADTSTAIGSATVAVFAQNDSGGGIVSFSTNQQSAAAIGGGLDSTKAGQLSSRINAFMTAYGINVY